MSNCYYCCCCCCCCCWWCCCCYSFLCTEEPLGWDSSNQGTQNLIPEKCSHNLCICYLCWRDTSIQGKETLFLVRKPGFIVVVVDDVVVVIPFCVQWNLLFGTAPIKGHKIWSRKNVHIICVFVTSVEGTPLFRGKRHFFWSGNPGLTSIQGTP